MIEVNNNSESVASDHPNKQIETEERPSMSGGLNNSPIQLIVEKFKRKNCRE